MPKMSITWHKECLKNQRKALEHEKEVLRQQQEKVERLIENCDKYDLQITTAEEKKKDGFDRDKFLKIKK